MTDSDSQSSKIQETARRVFSIESAAVAALGERLDLNLPRAVQLLLECRGRVVVTGIGKSGAIGRKLASSLASTGTPALFLHPAEGLHGDLGMVMPGDILIAISYSGRGSDLIEILSVVKDMGVPIVSITGNANSFLAARSDVVLNIAVEQEACPLNLAPTASTAAALAMGDALVVCTMVERDFTSEDFARFHPGGALGQGLKLRVADLMYSGERCAQVAASASVREALQAITAAGTGAAMVVDGAGRLAGYLTDGDVRRRLLNCDDAEVLLCGPLDDLMTRTPLALLPETSALQALRALQERGVDDAPVVGEDNVPAGILDVQELLRAGLL